MTPENNIKIWNKANNQPAPTKEDLQTMRSIDCRPEFLGSNNWLTPSTSKEGIYRQQVYFVGFNNNYSHGFELNIECSCPATKTCKHILKLQSVYCANWSYLFILFGMEEQPRMDELWTRANAVYERMETDERRAAA